MLNFIKKHKALFITFISVVIIDQLTKYLAVSNLKLHQEYFLIKDFLGLCLVYNEGAAWGIFGGQRIILSLISLISVILILFYYFKDYSKLNKITRYSLIMVASGAFGNMIDRMLTGKVIDFINVNIFIIFKSQFPYFNIADMFVTFGAFLFIFCALFIEKE